jgi:hypothetical protein
MASATIHASRTSLGAWPVWSRWILAWLSAGASAITLATVVQVASPDQLPAIVTRAILALCLLGVAALAASFALEDGPTRAVHERDHLGQSIDGAVGSVGRISTIG